MVHFIFRASVTKALFTVCLMKYIMGRCHTCSFPNRGMALTVQSVPWFKIKCDGSFPNVLGTKAASTTMDGECEDRKKNEKVRDCQLLNTPSSYWRSPIDIPIIIPTGAIGGNCECEHLHLLLYLPDGVWERNREEGIMFFKGCSCC